MILYHGSNVEVREPRLLKVQRELDFGKGFYTTSDLEQAAKWAKRTALRLHRKDSYISVYEVDETEMSRLRMLRFNAPDVEWLRFVVKNRKGEPIPVDWDIVSGPVADDRTASVIDLYLDGMYDEEETIKRLLPQKLKDQNASNSMDWDDLHDNYGVNVRVKTSFGNLCVDYVHGEDENKTYFGFGDMF